MIGNIEENRVVTLRNKVREPWHPITDGYQMIQIEAEMPDWVVEEKPKSALERMWSGTI